MRKFSLDSWNEYDEALALCKKALLSGKFAVLPTDTLYGICANALDEKAVASVSKAKGRDSKPISIIVSDIVMMEKYAEIPENAGYFFQTIFPGPATVLLKAKHKFPKLISPAGTVGVRVPHYIFTTTLCRQSGVPLTATSANLAGGKPPTRLSDVPASLLKSAAASIDGGPTKWGEGSTIIDLTAEKPSIVRRGADHERISKLLEDFGGK